ncbi:MAG: hypothetical protein V4808_12835 [Pseudomonadota bacterium]
MFVLLLVALAAAIAAPRPHADLAFARGEGGHALINIGFASIKLAFDFGHKCSNPNGCGGAIL